MDGDSPRYHATPDACFVPHVLVDGDDISDSVGQIFALLPFHRTANTNGHPITSGPVPLFCDTVQWQHVVADSSFG